MSHFFISYSHNDTPFVDELESKLSEEGILTWTDRHIKAGEEWKVAIDVSIKKSIGVIVVITPASLASPYTTYEWSFAKGLDNGRKQVIPILLQEPDDDDPIQIHPRLLDIQYSNFTDPSNR